MASGNTTIMVVAGAARSLLVWHVHSSWTESPVAGTHIPVVPVNPAKDVDGRGLRQFSLDRFPSQWDEVIEERCA